MVFRSTPNQYKTEEICDLVVSLYPSLIVYCPDKYIAQRMCHEAVDNSLASLELISDCFVTSKMIKKNYTVLFSDDGLLFLINILAMLHFVVRKWVFLV